MGQDFGRGAMRALQQLAGARGADGKALIAGVRVAGAAAAPPPPPPPPNALQAAIALGHIAEAAGGMQAEPLGAGGAAHAQPAHLPGSSLVPSRGTVIAVLVAIHVAALLYWAWVVIRAYRKGAPVAKPREPPRKVNCMYEWSSLPLPRLGSVRSLSLGITRS
ncbi:hypothetical protein WJX81_000889 [Elliptochloris bilobata]|uniref:Uncharacterized protein n=1 Tax=Elliptochloris bilobata TaxID=381761 RepID=A0AAW1S668_9CHLO